MDRVLDAGAMVFVCRARKIPDLAAFLRDTGEPRRAEAPVAAVPAPAPAPVAAPLAAVPAPEPCPLTNRELEILQAVAEGHTNARIGRSLWVTEQTVKFHLSNIYRKLGVANRTEASRYALMNDLFGKSLMARRRRPRPRTGRWLVPAASSTMVQVTPHRPTVQRPRTGPSAGVRAVTAS